MKYGPIKRCARAVLAMLAIGLAATAAHAQSGSGDAPKVAVSIPPSIFALPAYVGAQEGIFAQEGLDVELVVTTSPAESVSLLMGGNLQFAFIDIQNAILAVSNGMPVVVSVPHSTFAVENPADGIGFGNIIVLDNSGINSVKDLEGKAIGTSSIGGISHLTFKDTLEAAGVDVSKINWVEVTTSRQIPSLRQGQVDAVISAQPAIAMAMAEGGVRALATADAAISGAPLFGLFSTKQWASQNQETILKFQNAFFRASERIKSDRGMVNRILEQQLKIPAAIAPEVRLPNFAVAPFTVEGTQPLVDLLVRHGAIERGKVADLNEFYVSR